MYSHKINNQRGFSLFELLVTVTVVAILMSLIFPVIGQVREAARRTVCASNLRQFGAAIMAYTSDNRGRVPGTFGWSGALNRYPDMIWRGTPPTGAVEQFSSDKIINYHENISETELTENSGAWYCPNQKKNYREMPALSTVNGLGGETWFISYTYFGQVSQWWSETFHGELLTDMRLDPNRIVMSDRLYRWHVTEKYGFNHGTSHSAGYQLSDGPGRGPAISGVNQLFGDGSVRWKTRAELHPEKLDFTDASVPHTSVTNTPGDQFFF